MTKILRADIPISRVVAASEGIESAPAFSVNDPPQTERKIWLIHARTHVHVISGRVQFSHGCVPALLFGNSTIMVAMIVEGLGENLFEIHVWVYGSLSHMQLN
jgi:hypothetical protein